MKKISKIQKQLSSLILIIIGAALCFGFFVTPLVSADQYQQQIDALQGQNGQIQQGLNGLSAQADSYQAALNQVAAQIAGVQDQINATTAQISEVQSQIAANQIKLAQEKQTLDTIIHSMYVDGNMTTLEMLATSNSISDFVTKEEYQNIVQNQIQNTLTAINQLQASLKQQKAQLNVELNSQQSQENQLAAFQAQQAQLLAYTQAQQAQYTAQIQSNNSQIATLRAEQIAANRRLVGTGHVDYSGTCGGSYPASANGPDGNWGCDYSLDSSIDNWGMDNRECVSYTAWMVYKTYGYMPYWGGSGDAREWPGDAAAAGIPTGDQPEVGSVAIYMGGSSDPWGHAMWVKSVNGDGTITVDQYNLYYDGNFYETTIPSAGLVYIYFGQ